MGGSAGGESDDPDFQIAPIIDVLLVLLIFFMSITSAQVLKIDKNIFLPVAKNGEERDDKGKGAVLLNVAWDKALGTVKVSLDETVLDLEDKEKSVEMIRQKAIDPATKKHNPKARLLIRADRLVTAKYINKVLELGAEAGLDNIAFTGLNQEDQAMLAKRGGQ